MTRPMEWLAAVRDHPEKPAPMQCHVLTMLAVRMDWTTGTGFVSVTQMAGDAGASEHTAKRATSWARHPCECHGTGGECAEHRLLHRTKRGHRMYNGETKASEWELTLPVQRATDGTLKQGASDSIQGANGRHATCQSAPHNVPVETVHLELDHHDLVPSANGNGAGAVDAHAWADRIRATLDPAAVLAVTTPRSAATGPDHPPATIRPPAENRRPEP